MPSFHIVHMVIHMKTTLNIPDSIYRQIKKRAAERGHTVSEVVAEYLLRGLAETAKPVKLPPLPTFHMGEPLVDVADRKALYDFMNQDNPRIQKMLGNESE